MHSLTKVPQIQKSSAWHIINVVHLLSDAQCHSTEARIALCHAVLYNIQSLR